MSPDEYGDLCARLDRCLRDRRTTEGVRVVRDVIALARRGDGRPPQDLPDLVVHWEEVASASPLRLANPKISARPSATSMTGQHAPEGFFLLSPIPRAAPVPSECVRAEDLHRIVLAGLVGGLTSEA